MITIWLLLNKSPGFSPCRLSQHCWLEWISLLVKPLLPVFAYHDEILQAVGEQEKNKQNFQEHSDEEDADADEDGLPKGAGPRGRGQPLRGLL